MNIEFYLEASESRPARAKPKLPKPPQAHVSLESNAVDAWACIVLDVSLLLEGVFLPNMFWMLAIAFHLEAVKSAPDPKPLQAHVSFETNAVDAWMFPIMFWMIG